MAGVAGGEPGVRVGGGGAVGVGDLVGPAGGAVGRDLDLVAGDGGAAGCPGGSSTSVTVIVTVTVSVPPLPSSALTTTVWVDLASWL